MTIDPRTPVIIGVAQVNRTPPDDLTTAPDPVDLMTDAVREAAADAGGTGVADAIDLIAVVGGLWRYQNPGAMVAADLGIDAKGMLTTMGGNMPIHTTHMLGGRIAAGELDVAVLTCGETNITRQLRKKAGVDAPVRDEVDAEGVERWGPALDMGDRTAVERGGETPRNSYAVLDSAIRSSRGETLDAARDRAASLWAGYAEVASRNPHAADPSGASAAEIREPSPANRMVSWPYTKAMCANNTVDQAAAIIICAQETADRLGVPVDRRVYPHLCVEAHDTPTFVDREDVAVVPGLDAACAAVRERVGDIEAIEHIDLYACFPAIVTLTCAALGISPQRQLTVAGGLAYAGAPLNFAAGQALVAMVDTLRADPGSRGLVQGNGGHATKHAIGVYSTTPPASAPVVEQLGHIGGRRPVVAADHAGDAVLRGVTVEFGHDGPIRAVAVAEFADGSRTWANSDDPALMDAIVTRETVGEAVRVDAGIMHLPD
ncbi:MAG: hypothetical protein AAF548_13740 [Actinomycetota bacterium]